MAKPPKPPAEQPDTTFMREVDDAVRRSDRENFFRRYGWWLLALIIVIFVAWGGYIYWRNQQQEQAGELAESYVKALDELNNGPDGKRAEDALKTFEAIGAENHDGYGAAAQMMQANILAARGETKRALAIYKDISGNDDFAKAFRDLALIRATLAEYDSMSPDAVIKRLKPLAEQGEPYFGTAGELVGLAYVAQDKTKEAGKLFTTLAKDESVPNEIRGRAQLMANKLGIDLDPDSESDKAVQPSESGDSADKSEQ